MGLRRGITEDLQRGTPVPQAIPAAPRSRSERSVAVLSS